MVSCCAALCRVASRRAVARCTVARCAAVCRGLAWCRGGSVEVSLACVVVRMRAGVWLAGGWGVRLGVGVSLGPCCGCFGVPLGLVGRVGRSRDGPWGCPPWGPVPWSRVLWGFRSQVLGAAAVPSSSSGACEVALVVAGVVACR